ncbi:hypothetical protein QWJ34_21990 [Saccharibacillus sp. CPCC 101409]|uniref:hypothetical protein n=1 Tax=Saccharibacillus sp. CPCC 101409 TaxID=3058041 RepID=UPI00267321A7|nr:hypothetical protein [Saccharibacillus sp. CPCC 101409]MDO3412451.1 hypothetical protein [Saccharibacillus sp. CPCC 101409]
MGNDELKQLSRASIQEAFLLLLEERSWERISITDIIAKAGVSRMTYSLVNVIGLPYRLS